jgi:hypothetical protein
MTDKTIEQMLAEVNLDAEAALWKLPKVLPSTLDEGKAGQNERAG